MGAGGNFWHHSPKRFVLSILGRDNIRQNALVIGHKGRGRFITTGFNAEDNHGFLYTYLSKKTREYSLNFLKRKMSGGKKNI